MVFFGGSHGPPLCTNGSAGYLMQLSVNRVQCKKNLPGVICSWLHNFVREPPGYFTIY